MKKILFLILLYIPSYGYSQVETNAIPYCFSNKSDTIKMSSFVFKNFNTDSLIQSEKKILNYKKYCFAKSLDVSLEFSNKFQIETDSFNIKLQRIIVPGSMGLAIYFQNFNLLPNEKIFIFNENKSYLIGALTHKNNKQSGFLHTRFIPDDTIIIEYHQLKDNNSTAVSINSIAAAYRQISGSSDWCEININCDNSQMWQTVKKSVAKISYRDDSDDSYYVCTGQLVANANLDNTPYFLTANHCINSETEANTAVFYFNYETEDCLSTQGSNDQSVSGSQLIATANDKLDFTLLQLSVVPPEVYEPYYAGWSRTEIYTDTSICIHHPAGDFKKISKTFIPLELSSFSGYDYNKHWQVVEWNEGTTEGGSSGSGLYTKNGFLIGTLSGGDASCDYNYNDLYQQFFHQWDDYNSANKQLAFWLDPYGIRPFNIQGYYPYSNLNLAKPTDLSASLIDSTVTLNWQATQPAADKYFVYKNLKKIAETDYPETIYTQLVKDSVYVFHVTAIFNNKESKPSNMEVILYGDTSQVPKVTDVRIYPNPTKDFVNIVAPDTVQITQVDIVNYDGRLVLSQIVDGSRYTSIDVSNLPPSWYIIRIFSNGIIYNRKLIKYIE